MKDKLLFGTIVTLAIIIAATSVRANPIYLSLYGNQGAHVGCFNETVDQSVVFDLTATLGVEFQGSNRYFGIRSNSNSTYGCNLPDTSTPPGCGGYDITAWFEPGDLIIGHINGSGDQNASLEGNEWEGHVPEDFTSIRIDYQSGFPCESARTIILPITWTSSPVAARASTWGNVKALYQLGGEG